VQLFHLGKFAFGACGVAHGLIETAQTEMGVGLGRIQLDSVLESGQGVGIAFLLHQDGSQVDISKADVLSDLHGLLEQGKGSVKVILLDLDIAEVSEGLSVVGINGQFVSEGDLCFLKIVLLPVEVA